MSTGTGAEHRTVEDAEADVRVDEAATSKRSLFDPAILGPATRDSFRKLDPRVMARNPVMFVVEIGAVLTSVLCVADWSGNASRPDGTQQNVFALLVTVWLWATVLFANFAEAMAEGRGKAQAATMRRTRAETVARVRLADGEVVERASTDLQVGDLCVVVAG